MSLCGFLNIASQFPNDAGQDALTVIAAILERHGYSASVLDTADRSPLMAEWARIAAMVEIYEKACESVRQHRIAKAEKADLRERRFLLVRAAPQAPHLVRFGGPIARQRFADADIRPVHGVLFPEAVFPLVFQG